MLQTFNARTECAFDVKQIKLKFNRLRQQHDTFSHLLQQTGFGWDTETNTITTTEEVWSTYLWVHNK